MRVGSPCMNDKELYARILGIERPLDRERGQARHEGQGVVVCVAVDPSTRLLCSTCGKVAPGLRLASTPLAAPRHVPAAHDPRSRRSSSRVPDRRDPTDLRAMVPSRTSRFTALFESLVIDWAARRADQVRGRSAGHELGRGRHDSPARREARSGTTQTRSAGSDRRRRNLVPEASRVRDDRDRTGRRTQSPPRRRRSPN
jgi:hypothetical protein